MMRPGNPAMIERLEPVDRKELFDTLVPALHRIDQTSIRNLLFCGNKLLHQAALAASFHTIDVHVESPAASSCSIYVIHDEKLDRLLTDVPLGSCVKAIRFLHRPLGSGRGTERMSSKDDRNTSRERIWELAAVLIDHCNQLQSFRWELGLGIGGRMWEAISRCMHLLTLHLDHPATSLFLHCPSFPRITPQLQRDTIAPTGDHVHRQKTSVAVGQGGWALGPGWEKLEQLSLKGLSQSGSKTLAAHLQILAQQPSLAASITGVTLDTQFLDSNLLSSIARYGSLGSLRHLVLSTSGTRLTAECLQEVIEGCVALQSLTLSDAEGRLDKNTWSMIDAWPASFHRLSIEVNESATHHSWALHHLESLHFVPIHQLAALSIRRIVHPAALLPFPPPSISVPPNQYEFHHIPEDLLEALTENGSRLEYLCLDWWEMSGNQLDGVVKACPALRSLQVAVEFPLVKLPLMATTFSAVPHLEQLIVTSTPERNIGCGTSKFQIDPPSDLTTIPPYLLERLQEQDPTIPDPKEMRKFVRRLPRFKLLSWIGRGGKGDWRFSKRTTLVNVVFTHSAILTAETWASLQAPQEAMFDYDEIPPMNGPAVLELPQPIGISTTPATEFPALTRSSTLNSLQSPKTPRSPYERSSPVSVSSGRTRQTSLTPIEWGVEDLRVNYVGNGNDVVAASPKAHRRVSAPTRSSSSMASPQPSRILSYDSKTAPSDKTANDLKKPTKRTSLGSTTASAPPLPGLSSGTLHIGNKPSVIKSTSTQAGGQAKASSPAKSSSSTRPAADTSSKSSELCNGAKSKNGVCSGAGAGTEQGGKDKDKCDRKGGRDRGSKGKPGNDAKAREKEQAKDNKVKSIYKVFVGPSAASPNGGSTKSPAGGRKAT